MMSDDLSLRAGSASIHNYINIVILVIGLIILLDIMLDWTGRLVFQLCEDGLRLGLCLWPTKQSQRTDGPRRLRSIPRGVSAQ